MRPIWTPDAEPARWETARPHLRTLIETMALKFGEIDVFLQFSIRERCDTRCQNAEHDDCICRCIGENHGGAAYWRGWTQVGDATLVSSPRYASGNTWSAEATSFPPESA
ncbi:hypothetical protein ACVWXU_008590 [Streptomyces sp. TE33382]